MFMPLCEVAVGPIKAGRRELNKSTRATLEQYLLKHEGDIADDINDFGDLKAVFYEMFLEYPKPDKLKRDAE